eukprot:15917154-Heterocapsa_arctica.AAC.1
MLRLVGGALLSGEVDLVISAQVHELVGSEARLELDAAFLVDAGGFDDDAGGPTLHLLLDSGGGELLELLVHHLVGEAEHPDGRG